MPWFARFAAAMGCVAHLPKGKDRYGVSGSINDWLSSLGSRSFQRTQDKCLISVKVNNYTRRNLEVESRISRHDLSYWLDQILLWKKEREQGEALILGKKLERVLSTLLRWLATLVNVAARVFTSFPSRRNVHQDRSFAKKRWYLAQI